MPLKPGRPDIGRYVDRFDVPAATGAWGVTFLGVASLLLDDGETRLMTDGFSRVRRWKGAAREDRTRPCAHRRATLARIGVDRLAAVVPVHTPLRPRDGLRRRRRPDRSGARGRRVHGVRRARAETCPPGAHPHRDARRADVRCLHADASRVPPLPAGPLPRRDHRARRATGADRRSPLRRGLVDPRRARRRRQRPAAGAVPGTSPGRSPDGARTSPTWVSASSASRARTTSAPTGPRPSRPSAPGSWC